MKCISVLSSLIIGVKEAFIPSIIWSAALTLGKSASDNIFIHAVFIALFAFPAYLGKYFFLDPHATKDAPNKLGDACIRALPNVTADILFLFSNFLGKTLLEDSGLHPALLLCLIAFVGDGLSTAGVDHVFRRLFNKVTRTQSRLFSSFIAMYLSSSLFTLTEGVSNAFLFDTENGYPAAINVFLVLTVALGVVVHCFRPVKKVMNNTGSFRMALNRSLALDNQAILYADPKALVRQKNVRNLLKVASAALPVVSSELDEASSVVVVKARGNNSDFFAASSSSATVVEAFEGLEAAVP